MIGTGWRALAVRRVSNTIAKTKATSAPSTGVTGPSVHEQASSIGNGTGVNASSGGTNRSWFRTISTISAIPLLAGGTVIAAYHTNDDFRDFINYHMDPANIESLKNLFHIMTPYTKIPLEHTQEQPIQDDYELARRPEVPPEDLEEQGSSVNFETDPPDIVLDDHMVQYLHVLLQHKEDQLRQEFNDNIDQRIRARLESQLNIREQEICAKYSSDLIAQQKAIEGRLAAERSGRMEQMAEIASKLVAVDEIIAERENKLQRSQKAHALTAAVITLDHSLRMANPLQLSPAIVKEFGNDNAVHAVLQSLPDRVAPSLEQLRLRFKSVYKACRRGALIPPDSGILGHLLGAVFSLLLINRETYVTGNDDISKLSRAQYHLSRLELKSAVDEMETLNRNGLASDLASDWLADAKYRLIVEQALSVLKLYAYELSAHNLV